MKKHIHLIYFLTIVGTGLSKGQTQINYPHCDCVEKVNYSSGGKENFDGPYQLTCNNNQIVTGQYVNGLRTGEWTTKTATGTIIKSAKYDGGKLNGKYELFHFGGTPKLVASFSNGQQDGLWKYLNEKGKIIKMGSYQAGTPTGVWTIFDKGGKRIIAAYDFNNQNAPNPSAAPYFKNGGIQRDDQSGEWYIIYYPERNPESEIQPIGGYALSCDLFLRYLTIPPIMMDTYTNFDFGVTLQVENNMVKNMETVFVNGITYNPKLPTFPFIVSTNPPRKLKRIVHSKHSIDLLREDIEETIRIMGPWIGNSTVDIYVPFVLNDIRRF
jgi:antitoxin component YwqK of YwqJK toxin-antitoxin module